MQHPLVASLQAKLPAEGMEALQVLLDSVAASLPVEMIYSDYSTHARDVKQTSISESDVLNRLKQIKRAIYGDGPGDPKMFLQIVRSTHLLDGHVERAEKMIEDVFS
jgi:hypothetical protein